MRRPVKPFVTEYRSGSRRSNPAPGQSPRLDLNKAEAERADTRPAEPWGSAPVAGSSAAPQEDSYEAALRAADALFSGRRQSAADPAARTAEAVPPHPTGGRILRAIDEPPPPELLRLEAEFAPKRRGRKPGSKNKPKIPAQVAQPAIAAAPILANEAPSPALMAGIAIMPAVATSAARQPAGPRPSRYAWVRTKLKPGEKWKRRIPKVVW